MTKPDNDGGKARTMEELRPSLSWGDALQYIMEQDKIIKRLERDLELWRNTALANKDKLEDCRLNGWRKNGK